MLLKSDFLKITKNRDITAFFKIEIFLFAIFYNQKTPLSLNKKRSLNTVISMLYRFFPCRKHEQNYDRIYFQPADEHIENKDDFRKSRKGAEGRKSAKRRSDIVYAACNRRKGLCQIKAVYAYEQERSQENDDIYRKECRHAVNRLVRHRLTVDFDSSDGGRRDYLFKRSFRVFCKNDYSRNLQAACRGACASAEEHQRKKYVLRKLWPCVDVHCRKACRGNN